MIFDIQIQEFIKFGKAKLRNTYLKATQYTFPAHDTIFNLKLVFNDFAAPNYMLKNTFNADINLLCQYFS